MTNDNSDKHISGSVPTLPANAGAPINRCNLPAVILGSLTFQQHPAPLVIDGIDVLYRSLFERLDRVDDVQQRNECFIDYMTVHFRLHMLEDAGFDDSLQRNRGKANFIRLLRGWMFDANSQEGAVLKGWVESRFGLLPRFHKGKITSVDSDAYIRYQQERQTGLYNTNALEAQLDLLYSYCQYELARQFPRRSHWRLYRGCNHIEECGQPNVCQNSVERQTILFNNISSFSTSPEQAGAFGDIVIAANVPAAKIFFSSQLLPGMLRGEDEMIVIGGVYGITVTAV